uniref:Uncharacterized protein n=1 Tax=Triticum urartu TaxID=4572 RepID=A0A8R7V779_TRIUA
MMKPEKTFQKMKIRKDNPAAISRQAMHCALKFCQYPGGKCRSTVFGAGCPSSSIRSMFSLQKQGRSSGKFLHSPLQPHILLCVNLYPTPMLLGFVPLLF